jgi:GNAT superfamily N-acetyltransferase
MGPDGLHAVSLDERPELAAELDALDTAWPPFMRHGKVVRRYWGSIATTRPQFQVALLDSAREAVVAKGHAIPIAWSGEVATLPDGVDEVLKEGLLNPPTRPTTLCALAVVVAPDERGRGLSALVLEAMRGVAARCGLRDLIAPVRPTGKSSYPLTPIERYMCWTDSSGLPFDPWLRVHVRLGGRVLEPAPRSMVVAGTVAEWERWSGLRFVDSGRYLVPGALQPVSIDRERDAGRYEEPNVWVHHA